jgi:hypothetical protein
MTPDQAQKDQIARALAALRSALGDQYASVASKVEAFVRESVG